MPKRLVVATLTALDRQATTLTADGAYALSLELGTSYAATVCHLADMGLLTTRRSEQLLHIAPQSIKKDLGGLDVAADTRRDVHLVHVARPETSVAVMEGDALVIEVPETPSSGYLWQVIPSAGLALVRDEYRSPDAALGGRGWHRFLFRAETTGQWGVALELRRPWQHDGAAAEVVRVTVMARPQPTPGLVQPELLAARRMATVRDLRDRQSPIKDQGRRGTCVAFAATAGHEMLRADREDLGEEFLHWAAKGRDGLPAPAEGTTLAAAAAALADVGQPLEALWPYDDRRDQWAAAYGPPDGILDEAARRRVRGGHTLPPTPTALRDALDEGLAVLLGFRLYATWYTPDADGRIALPATGAVAFGGHAVLVVGYDVGDTGVPGHLVVQNSWGRTGLSVGMGTGVAPVAWLSLGFGATEYPYARSKRSRSRSTLARPYI